MEQNKRKQLLKLIESDCRLSIEEYAVMLGEDEVIVSAEIKRMEQEKIICGYRALIDWIRWRMIGSKLWLRFKQFLKVKKAIARLRSVFGSFLKSNRSFSSAAALTLSYYCKDATSKKSQNSFLLI